MRAVAAALLAGALALAAPARAHEPVAPWTVGASAADVLATPPGTFSRLGRGAGPGEAVLHRAGGRPAGGGTGGTRVETVDTGVTALEPTMGVTLDGTLFYVGATRDSGLRSIVLRSRDGGRTWEETDPLVPGVRDDTQTGDPFLYVDKRTDRLFNADYTPPCAYISRSDDRGSTYAFSTYCQHTDHQNLFAGPPPAAGPQPQGYPNLVYYCAIDGGAAIAHLFTGCSRSTDGGASFQRTGSPPYPPQPGGPDGERGIFGCSGAAGHGAVGPDGTVYLPRGYCDTPTIAISRDAGTTWQRVAVAANGMAVGVTQGFGVTDHDAIVAVDRDGNVYYTWIALDHLPYLAISRDGGRTWGAPLMVAAPGVREAFGVTIDVGDPGRVAIAYVGSANAPGPPFCTRASGSSCTNADGSPGRTEADYAGSTWNGYLARSVDVLRADPTFATGLVNDPADPLIRGACGPVRCQQTFDFIDVVVAPDGTAWAPFVDGCPPDPAEACPLTGRGIAGHLVGGPPLVGATADQRPAVSAPSQRGCRSRRSFEIRIAEPRRGRVRSARVTVAGKRVRVRRRGGRLRARVDLRGRPRQRVTVRITVRTTTGRTYRSVRRYRTCGG
jgi:hypothetical protein